MKVISTARQGRTLFVTLSQELLNGYTDEPEDWQQDPSWSAEVPLRRRLCIQSLVATVTENCDVDRVQILVEQSSASGSMRLKESYYCLTDDDSLLTDPVARDESLLLTPACTLNTVMTLWLRRDWSRLYCYIASADPDDGTAAPTLEQFIARMEALPMLTDWSAEGGSVSTDGSTVLYSLTLTGQDGLRNTVSFRLSRIGGIWLTSAARLESAVEGIE